MEFWEFLIDPSGNVVARYAPAYPPEKLGRILKICWDKDGIIFIVVKNIY